MVTLRNYSKPCRQVAVTGLGRAAPTLFVTNNEEVCGSQIVKRYINRNYIQNELGINVNFFHLDCLASELRLNVNLDVVLTVIANGCYRWLANSLRGCSKMEPKQLYRKFVQTGAHVHFDKRSHNPIIAQARLDNKPVLIPWLKHKRLRLTFT